MGEGEWTEKRNGRGRPMTYGGITAVAGFAFVLLSYGFIGAQWMKGVQDAAGQSETRLMLKFGATEERLNARLLALRLELDGKVSQVQGLAKENNAWLARRQPRFQHVLTLTASVRELEKDLAALKSEQAAFVAAIVDLTRAVAVQSAQLIGMQKLIEGLSRKTGRPLGGPYPG